ncbi:hypothetical protein AHAS_Ahas09G0213800 [Arachis hypogaea]
MKLPQKAYKISAHHTFFSTLQKSPNWQTVSTSHPSYYNEQCIIAAHMKTEAITEYRFGEEAERSDRSGGQCGHRDVRAEEEGDGNDNNES